MRPLRILLLLLAAADGAGATTVVVVRTAGEIVIGADSKVTDTSGKAFDRRACKIVQAGNLFFAYVGMARDRESGFDVERVARAALLLKPEATAAEKASVMTGALTTALFDELPKLKRADPATYRAKIEGKVFLKILVAAFERGTPLLFVRHFRAAPVGPERIGVAVAPDDCLADCRGDFVTRFLGETEAIEGLPEETPGFWDAGTIEGIGRLVEAEITARSEYVGPPVDILRMDRNGARWVRRKPECPAVEQRRQRPERPSRR